MFADLAKLMLLIYKCIHASYMLNEIRKVAWPSGLRRWFKAPVSSEARVRIPPLPKLLFSHVISDNTNARKGYEFVNLGSIPEEYALRSYIGYTMFVFIYPI